MQSIIQELYSLTLELQQDNRNLLKLIQHYSATPCKSQKIEVWPSQSIQQQQSQQSLPKNICSKFAEATSVSRVSKSTVKQSSQRCKSAQSLKQSRMTQKQMVRGKSGVSLTKKAEREETVLSRLKKVGQSRKGKVGPSLLVKKKSKIYHFQTHY